MLAIAFPLTAKSVEPPWPTIPPKPPPHVIRTLQPVSPKYEAAPQGETGVTQPQPIDASGAKSVEGVGAQVGSADLPPPPTPLDSDGDGYYNYAEVHYPGADPYDAAKYPAVSPATANTQWHDWYLQQVKAKTGLGKYYLAGAGAGAADATRVVSASRHYIQQAGQGVSKAARSTVNAAQAHPYVAAGVGAAVVAVVAVVSSSGGGGGGGGGSGGGGGGGGFAGHLFGSYGGTWTGRAGTGTGGGSLNITISQNGSVSGSMAGIVSGPVSGAVSANGSITFSGPGTTFAGTLSRSGSTITGSGGVVGSYAGGTTGSGGWSASGAAQ
ncbi:MAG: hypothetical protein NTV49_12270 [Kiritimatiellaeota bacterium]|nr:hypothetical protein [Kiritimatiellota bacterium]